MTRPRTVSINASIMLLIGRSSAPPRTRMRPRAFRKRSLSTGLAQKAGCGPERREIMTRRDSLDEVPKLLTQSLIGKSTGEGVERPKLQPASPLSAGGLYGTAQRSSGGFGFPAAISQLTVDSPQLGLEIALVAPV